MMWVHVYQHEPFDANVYVIYVVFQKIGCEAHVDPLDWQELHLRMGAWVPFSLDSAVVEAGQK